MGFSTACCRNCTLRRKAGGCRNQVGQLVQGTLKLNSKSQIQNRDCFVILTTLNVSRETFMQMTLT